MRALIVSRGERNTQYFRRQPYFYFRKCYCKSYILGWWELILVTIINREATYWIGSTACSPRISFTQISYLMAKQDDDSTRIHCAWSNTPLWNTWKSDFPDGVGSFMTRKGSRANTRTKPFSLWYKDPRWSIKSHYEHHHNGTSAKICGSAPKSLLLSKRFCLAKLSGDWWLTKDKLHNGLGKPLMLQICNRGSTKGYF